MAVPSRLVKFRLDSLIFHVLWIVVCVCVISCHVLSNLKAIFNNIVT